MAASTVIAVSGTAAAMCSRRTSADQVIASSGWSRLSWPMRAMPPVASPRYQAIEPRNMLMTPAHTSPAQASAPT
jgi:hypothetical protein